MQVVEDQNSGILGQETAAASITQVCSICVYVDLYGKSGAENFLSCLFTNFAQS